MLEEEGPGLGGGARGWKEAQPLAHAVEWRPSSLSSDVKTENRGASSDLLLQRPQAALLETEDDEQAMQACRLGTHAAIHFLWIVKCYLSKVDM